MPPVSLSRVFFASLAVAAFTLQNPLSAMARRPAPGGELRFLLSAVAQVVEDGQARVVPLAGGMALPSGSRIKFYAEFETAGRFYLFHEDSRMVLALLSPAEPDRTAVPPATPVVVPEGAGWIELDANPGRETFHLLVSSERRVRLEKLCAHHRTLEEKAAVAHSSRSILAEIRAAARESLDRPAERPMRIAGKLRGGAEAGAGAPPELLKSAVAVSAGGSYVKTITIIHE